MVISENYVISSKIEKSEMKNIIIKRRSKNHKKFDKDKLYSYKLVILNWMSFHDLYPNMNANLCIYFKFWQQSYIVMFVPICLIVLMVKSQVYDTQQKINNQVLQTKSCNSNNTLFFSFSPSSILTCANKAFDCSVTTASENQINYLDALGNFNIYKLAQAQAIKQSFLGGIPYAFLFKFFDENNNKKLYVALPFTDVPPSAENIFQTIKLPTKKYQNKLQLLGIHTIDNGLPLKSFNFLNYADFNQFYEVMDVSLKHTLLVSRYSFSYSYVPSTLPNISLFPINFNPLYSQTADVYCWGSFKQGHINLPMKRNAALWYFLCASLLVWLFVLIGDDVTPAIFEFKFKNNKWTCWSLYSLYFLGHDEFFTRMSRASLMLLQIFWQGLVITLVYCFGFENIEISLIIWAALLGWVLALPVPFLMGKIFLQPIYQQKIQKYLNLVDLRFKDMQKDRRDQLQRDTVMDEQNLRNMYYCYYVTLVLQITFIFIICVLTLQNLGYEQLHRNEQWLGSMAIALVFQYLIFEPLCTLLFGGLEFYQSRGYYFNSKVAQLYKKAD